MPARMLPQVAPAISAAAAVLSYHVSVAAEEPLDGRGLLAAATCVARLAQHLLSAVPLTAPLAPAPLASPPCLCCCARSPAWRLRSRRAGRQFWQTPARAWFSCHSCTPKRRVCCSPAAAHRRGRQCLCRLGPPSTLLARHAGPALPCAACWRWMRHLLVWQQLRMGRRHRQRQ